jgi:hypothetical protein
MPGALHRFLADDHTRLDALLRRAVADAPAIDVESYTAFRAGLLRHIAMEEKVLLPAARRIRGGDPLPIAARLREDHAALASLLVPTPTTEILRLVREILEEHNDLEECSGGMYEVCEQLAGEELATMLARLTATPEVPLARHFDGPRVHEHIAELLRARAERANG